MKNKKLSKWIVTIKDLRIKHKLMMVFLIIVILPVLFVGLFLTNQLKVQVLNQSFENAKNEVSVVSKKLNETISFNINLQNSILSDVKLRRILETRYMTYLDVFRDYENFKMFENNERTYESIDDIRIYSENNTLLNNLDFMLVTEEIKDTWWYKQALLWEGKVISGYYHDPIRKKEYLLIAKSHRLNKSEVIVIQTLISLDYLYELVKDEQMNIHIVDSKSQILSSTHYPDQGQDLHDLYGITLNRQVDSWRDIYKGEKSQIFLESINNNYIILPLYIISIVPLESILKPATDASRLGLFVMFFSICLTMIFINYFSDLLTKKISQMVKDTSYLAKGEFDKLHVYEEKDEIGILSKSLWNTGQSLKRLIKENEDIRKKEQALVLASEKMKFEVLVSQIQPHFLFNVLESLRMKSYLNGDLETSTGIRNLGTLMRRSVEMKTDVTTIKEEIEFIKSYMDLQMIRFSERFTYVIEVEEKLLNHEILPLLIQPLIENAIVHGIEELVELGKIIIMIEVASGYLCIKVLDNGMGFKSKENAGNNFHESLNSKLTYNSNSTHIGLKNVEGRIKNYYGKESELNVRRDYVDLELFTIVELKLKMENL